jgi:hypothetical protein
MSTRPHRNNLVLVDERHFLIDRCLDCAPKHRFSEQGDRFRLLLRAWDIVLTVGIILSTLSDMASSDEGGADLYARRRLRIVEGCRE